VSEILAVIVGALAVRFVVVSGRGIVSAPALQRTNYRGKLIPTAGGIFAVLAVLIIEAARDVLGSLGLGDEPGNVVRALVLFAAIGFGLVGFVDDILGTQEESGFRGHLRALSEGRLTTGAFKIAGGAAVALVLVGAGTQVIDGKRLLLDAALVALAANFVNLLDRAPGRALKVSLVAWIAFAVYARDDVVGVAIAPVMGAFLGLFGDDLRQRIMIGDSGAYVVGGVLGLAVVLDTGTGTRIGVLVVLAALTVLAEFVSYSNIIQRVAPLRYLDNLGRVQTERR
jgi:UDP-N-acetylmuramyl pentapeptide phosphotransferase/UDP-N-acetylglucosamine-1-phosphate transferase